MRRSVGNNRSGFAKKREEFSRSKLAMSLDYIFGKNTSNGLDFSMLEFQYSRRTGRLKYVLAKGTRSVLFSFRPNGSIGPTVSGFTLLLSKYKLSNLRRRPKWCVTVMEGVTDFVSQGKTVFCKHVVACSNQLLAGQDVAILNESGELLAAGRSIVAGSLIKQFKRGVAVKVREGSQKSASDEL
jgi:conserved protein with predicted RNA binding PUA domain